MAEPFLLEALAKRGLAEDLIFGDRTTDALFPRSIPARGDLLAKERLIVAGLDLFQTVFTLLDPLCRFKVFIETGEEAKTGGKIGRLTGDGRALLKGERVALNFFQHLCGIATFTRKFVQAVAGTGAKIVDTRKTQPGLRALEKEAVLAGGGYNHRFNLGDLVMIKDNHIALANGIVNAVKATRATLSHALKIEVEVDRFEQVKEAIQSGCEIIMLDNMSIPEINRSVALIRKKAPHVQIEVSGGIRLDNVASVARCGVDLISVGLITHSAPASDISLEITSNGENHTTRLAKNKGRHTK